MNAIVFGDPSGPTIAIKKLQNAYQPGIESLGLIHRRYGDADMLHSGLISRQMDLCQEVLRLAARPGREVYPIETNRPRTRRYAYPTHFFTLLNRVFALVVFLHQSKSHRTRVQNPVNLLELTDFKKLPKSGLSESMTLVLARPGSTLKKKLNAYANRSKAHVSIISILCMSKWNITLTVSRAIRTKKENGRNPCEH